MTRKHDKLRKERRRADAAQKQIETLQKQIDTAMYRLGLVAKGRTLLDRVDFLTTRYLREVVGER